MALQALIGQLTDLSNEILVEEVCGHWRCMRELCLYAICTLCVCVCVCECVKEGMRQYVLCDKIKEDVSLFLSQDQITPSKCILPQGPMRGHYHISTFHRFLIHSSPHSCVKIFFLNFDFFPYNPLPLFLSFTLLFSPSFLLIVSHPMHY